MTAPRTTRIRIRHLRGIAIAGVLSLTAAAPISAPRAQEGVAVLPSSPTVDPIASVRAWQLDEAEDALMTLRAQGGDPVRVTAAEVLIQFHRGDYKAAMEALERHPDPASLQPYDRLVANSWRLRRDAVEARSEHFLVRVEPGLDELLLPYAIETLDDEANAADGPDQPALEEILRQYGWTDLRSVRATLSAWIVDPRRDLRAVAARLAADLRLADLVDELIEAERFAGAEVREPVRQALRTLGARLPDQGA